jgi:hypothetical protein
MGLAQLRYGIILLYVSRSFYLLNHREGYLRMSSADYATDKLSDDYVHLTNNAI